MTKIFSCHNISKNYQTTQGQVKALQDVSFSVTEGEFVCLVGPSGCGKTTLLKLIAGLQEATSGYIIFANEASDNRFHSAMVFQEHGLFPWMTILDNAAFGLEMQGYDRPTRHKQAQAWLNRFGLADFTYHYPHQLSGGMRQRVAIARAFLANSEILLMDEPFGALDAQTRLVLQQELLQLWAQAQKTIVYVTHDIEEAILLSDRVIVMSSRPGRIQETIAIPLTRPRLLSPQSASLIAEIKWTIWKMLEADVRQTLNMTQPDDKNSGNSG